MSNFKWIGPVAECYNPALKNGFFDFYRSFSYRNEIYTVGDFVLINKTDNQRFSKIGKLLSVYNSKEVWHKDAPYRGTVRWYTWAKDMRILFNSLYKDFDENNEVVEDKRSTDIFISLEHIQRKCFLVFASEEDPVYFIRHQKLNPQRFFSVRYKIGNSELVPISSNEFKETLISSDKETDTTAVNKFNPLTKVTTPKKQFLTRSKRKTISKNSPIINLDSEGSDTEEFKVKSPTNSMKNIKLTPKSKNKTPKRIAVNRNASVRRVLNDSFEKESTSPLFHCLLISPKQDNPKSIKIKLKAIDKDLKVFPTKLDNNVLALRSPIKLDSLLEVNNCISLSPKKMNLNEEPDLPESELEKNSERNKIQQPITPMKRLLEQLSLDDNADTFVEKKRRNLRRNLNGTPKKEDNSRRASTRNVEKKLYMECESEDDDFKKESGNRAKILTRSTRNIVELKREESYENKPKRVITPPARFNDYNIDTPNKLQNKTSNSTRVANNMRNQNHSSVKKTEAEATKTPTRENLRRSVLRSASKKLIFNDSVAESPKTPKSTPRKPSKDTPTARARMVRDGTITPSVQARENAVVKDNTPLGKARIQLHVSYVPRALPCREKEFTDVMNFLEGKLFDGCGGCMYISGVPGTGKTATVTEVIRSLQDAAENGDVPTFKYVNINGMKLSEPKQAYVEIIKQLLGKTVSWEEAQTMLEDKFVKSKKKLAPIILLVDELDILCTKRQDVIYNLLDWPTKANAQLIVITIANTMDLPERLLMGRVTSRLGLTRLTFQAYTHKQLQEIVTKRLSDADTFNSDAIQLVARKVASVSGDARRALDICRRATEVAELEGSNTQVSMMHVNQAINAMITQPKVQAIKHCCRLEKLILQAVIAEVERTGVEETNFNSVMRMFVTIAALDGFEMVSNTIALSAVNRLGSCRLLLVDQKCSSIYQKIILNVSSDDVYYAVTKTDV